jgi:multidrug efflux system membrane fusion protein
MKPVCLIFFTILVFSVSCRNEAVRSKTYDAVRVKIVAVVPGTFSIPIHSSGLLVSSEEMKLSFKTGGIVAKIPVREGDKVKKGAAIAALNLAEIDAQVNLARNGYEKASRDYIRVRNLFADSVATLEQKQNALTALNISKSNLDIALFNRSHSKIVAPDNGVILKLFAKENELISAGYPVILFGTGAYGKNWKVKAGLSDRDIVKINSGDSATISFDAYPDIIFPAVVDQVGEMSNPMTGTYEIELKMLKTDLRLASGFIAAAEIYPSKKEIYSSVPVGAIIEADKTEGYLFLLTDSMTVIKQKIGIVTIIGDHAAVTGIPGGKIEVVSEGAAYLRDGEKVIVVK